MKSVSKRTSIICILTLLLPFTHAFAGGCGKKNAEVPSFEEMYVYENEGCMGTFTINLEADGKCMYYEGMASSHMGISTYTVDGNIITITDSTMSDYDIVNRFRMTDDALVWIEEGSDNFMYVKIKDGEKFIRSVNEAK